MKKLIVAVFLAINIFAVYAQSFTVKGTVVDESSKPIAYVQVFVKESGNIGTYTDTDGKFEISIYFVKAFYKGRWFTEKFIKK
jgi:protocatechuate 3,4-dioxygenase beta subunit